MTKSLDKIRELDYQLYVSIYKYANSQPSTIYLAYFFSRYGILIFFLSFIYLIWQKRINALICSFFAMALAGSIDLLIYIFWKRPRPYIAHADAVAPIVDNMRVDVASFPSSHTYIAFAVATSIFLYGHKKLGAFLFVIAILVAISRIATGLHYPSDTIGGALLGIASGTVAYLIIHRTEKYWD